MNSDWLNDFASDPILGEEPLDSFYCPYTNAAKCALLTKGWQPQELCLALECDQMKLIRRNKRTHGRDKAA